MAGETTTTAFSCYGNDATERAIVWKMSVVTVNENIAFGPPERVVTIDQHTHSIQLNT